MSEVIHLKVKRSAATERDENIEKVDLAMMFMESCLKLDASLFEPYINDEHIFQDLDKFRFLASMKANFDKVRKKGHTETRLEIGNCMGCQRGHVTYGFYTGRYSKEFAYVIMRDERGNLSDIFQCYLSRDKVTDDLMIPDVRSKNFMLSDEEKLEMMSNKNPNIDLLKDMFDLEE